MIKINLFLDSAIHSSRDRSLGSVEISNDGTGTSTLANYDCVFYQAGAKKVVWKKTKVTNFPRKQKKRLRYSLHRFKRRDRIQK